MTTKSPALGQCSVVGQKGPAKETAESAPLHVIPRARGRWAVTERAGSSYVLSEHADASAALRAASHEARSRGCREVLVHDRYFHVHHHHAAAP